MNNKVALTYGCIVAGLEFIHKHAGALAEGFQLLAAAPWVDGLHVEVRMSVKWWGGRPEVHCHPGDICADFGMNFNDGVWMHACPQMGPASPQFLDKTLVLNFKNKHPGYFAIGGTKVGTITYKTLEAVAREVPRGAATA